MKRPWLTPFTPLYALLLCLRNRRIQNGSEPVRRLRYPVVSIGNLSTGGSGKTPLTIALAQALTQRGFAVDVLSRGYGRQSKLPARVNPNGTAEEFGDEPLLIAQQTGLPVYVARQRYDAGLLAEADFDAQPSPSPGHLPAVHLLDDGFQHRQLHRDVDILLLNSADLGDRLLPAGNLREPLSALRRATILAIPDDELGLESQLQALGWQGPLWRLRRTMQIPSVSGRVLAFCGIARPAQFFAGLESAGITLAARQSFPDHHSYTPSDLHSLAQKAMSAQATTLLTTEKDQARLGSLAATLPASLPLLAVPFRTEIDAKDAPLIWLQSRLS